MLSSQIKIIKLPVDKWKDYKQLRLEALKKEPTSFAASIDDIKIQPDIYWKVRLNSKDSVLYFAQVDGQLVGVAGYRRDLGQKVKHKASIFGVYVQEKFRGGGIALKLLEKILEDLKSNKEIIKIDLDVNTKNTAAISLYKKLGFKIVGTYYKELKIGDDFIDLYEMEKIIK